MFYDALESQRLLYHSADQQYIYRAFPAMKRETIYIIGFGKLPIDA